MSKDNRVSQTTKWGVCPHCDSRDLDEWSSGSYTVGAITFYSESTFLCNDCGLNFTLLYGDISQKEYALDIAYEQEEISLEKYSQEIDILYDSDFEVDSGWWFEDKFLT